MSDTGEMTGTIGSFETVEAVEVVDAASRSSDRRQNGGNTFPRASQQRGNCCADWHLRSHPLLGARAEPPATRISPRKRPSNASATRFRIVLPVIPALWLMRENEQHGEIGGERRTSGRTRTFPARSHRASTTIAQSSTLMWTTPVTKRIGSTSGEKARAKERGEHGCLGKVLRRFDKLWEKAPQNSKGP